jgi:hypothetical protein
MEPQAFAWVNLAMDTVEVAGLGAVLLLLLRVHRNIAALLRVLRRMDRKTPDPTAGAYRHQAELNEARMQVTGGPEAQPERPAAD